MKRKISQTLLKPEESDTPMAVKLKIALAATGLAKSSNPGRKLRSTTIHTEYNGVPVYLLTSPNNPRSDRGVKTF